MGRFFHTLGQNLTREFPRNWCFVDTETSELRESARVKVQMFRLGVACYVRDGRDGHAAKEYWHEFKDVQLFWETAVAASECDRHFVVIGYNMGFDFRIVDGFRQLTGRGYAPKVMFLSQFCLIIQFVKDKHTILIIDAMNYFRGTLEQWGDMFGLPKIDVDFNNVSDKRLFEHCRRDVEILKRLWYAWRAFLSENDLGHFSPTVPSQALTAFRHRFMQHKIYIHAHEDVTDLERDAYFGGRTDCFFVGRKFDGPYYKLDVNSMYSAVACKLAVPVKFIRLYRGFDAAYLRKALRSWAVIAEVDIQTRHNCYPVRRDEGLTFPIGTFRTCLCGPELQLALRHRDIVKVVRFAVYRRRVVFDQFVRQLYRVRQKYKRTGNKVFGEMVKRLLNSLYGKFGQQNVQWKYEGYFPNEPDGVYTIAEQGSEETYQERVIFGHLFREYGEVEAFHSFPAIAGYITSAARAYLWRLIRKAGQANVYYCDTDSLIVSAAGYKRLRSLCDSQVLGKLKCEYKTQNLRIESPKDYETDKEKHIKGVTVGAVETSPGVFSYWRWEGMVGAIRTEHLDRVYMYRTQRVLAREYLKGQVSASGVVSPIVLAAS